MYDCGLERTLMMMGLIRDTESYGVRFEVKDPHGVSQLKVLNPQPADSSSF